MNFRFVVEEKLIYVVGDTPGSHATLFGPDGTKLRFDGDASRFSDADRDYWWAFEQPSLADGDYFVFATADYHVVGVCAIGTGLPSILDDAGDKFRVERLDGKPHMLMRAYGENIDWRAVNEPSPTKLITLGKMPSSAPERGLRCMFVNPSVPYNQWACYRAGVMNEGSFSSHGMAYVSATLKADGHTCWLVDLRSLNDWQHTRQVLSEQDFDVVFVGFLSIDAFNAACVVRLLKELHPSKPVVVGGLHVSIAKEPIFPRPDLVDYYCFHGDTKVITQSGAHALRELAGRTEAVLSKDGVYRPATFRSFGQQELFEIEFNDGITILATAEHRWPTVSRNGNEVVVTTLELPGRNLIRNVAPRPPRGELFRSGVQHGFVFGDGTCYNEGRQARACFFGDKDKPMLSFFEDQRAPVACTGGVAIHGLPAEWKRLPRADASAEYWYGFVCGFFAADGCVRASDGCAVLTQKSRATLAAIAEQLPRIGMAGGRISGHYRHTVLSDREYEGEMFYLALLRSFLQPEDFLLSRHRANFEATYRPTNYGRYTQVRAVRVTGLIDEVFCGVEDETHTLTLANGVLTGNCWGNQDLYPEVLNQFLRMKGEPSYDARHFPLADYVILDDGEIAARALVRELAAGRVPAQRTIDGGAVPMEVARHMDRDLFRLDFEAYSPILPFQPTPMVTVTWARGCPFHCRYSLTGDTIVFTDDGPVEMKSLLRGIALARECAHGAPFLEYRLSVDVASPSGRSRATWGVDEGVRPILRVEAEGGLQVKATPEHQFLCAEEDELKWRRADELKVGAFMVVRQPERAWPTMYPPLTPPNVEPYLLKRPGFPHVLDESLAWLTGFLVGDGCLPRDGRAVVQFCVPPDSTKHREIVERVFGTPLHVYPFAHTDKQFQGQIHSRLAREVFVQSLGVDPEDKLKIPPIFWRAPKAVLAAFVDGLFEADGYRSDENGLYLTTVSERLARDVAYALLMLGRGCPNIVTVDPENADGAARSRQYRVGVLQNDRIPSTRGIYRSTKSGRWYWRTHKSPNRLGLRRRTLREAGLHHPLDRDGWYYVRVRGVTPCPAEPVYDITVPDGEAFVANGFVAHNCNLASQLSNTNVRQKPVELVDEELADLHRRFNGRLGSLMIHDDLTFHPKHIAQWCELILSKYGPIPIWMQTRADWVVTRYKRDRPFWDLICKAGLTWVSVGYESGSQRMLDYMQKDNTVENNRECGRILNEYGINSFGNFLWGCPTETHEEAEETVRLVQEIKPGFLSGSIYCNYPGTQLDAECREKGHLVPGEVYARSHLPWQVTVRGMDYAHRIDCVQRAGSYANYLRMPKLLSEDRQRDLAACSRGLPIH